MSEDRRLTETSKFLSYVLRHRPEEIGLELDSGGWADIDALIAGAIRGGREMDRELIDRVVLGASRGRLEISEDGLRIRAVHGHSTGVLPIEYRPESPPHVLYHGTSDRNLSAIRAHGLIARERQYVHLSSAAKTAESIGQRHGKPVVLKIRTSEMHQRGIAFFHTQSDIWLTREVPAEFIDFSD